MAFMTFRAACVAKAVAAVPFCAFASVKAAQARDLVTKYSTTIECVCVCYFKKFYLNSAGMSYGFFGA